MPCFEDPKWGVPFLTHLVTHDCLVLQLPGAPVQAPYSCAQIHTDIYSHTLVKIRNGNTLWTKHSLAAVERNIDMLSSVFAFCLRHCIKCFYSKFIAEAITVEGHSGMRTEDCLAFLGSVEKKMFEHFINSSHRQKSLL